MRLLYDNLSHNVSHVHGIYVSVKVSSFYRTHLGFWVFEGSSVEHESRIRWTRARPVCWRVLSGGEKVHPSAIFVPVENCLHVMLSEVPKRRVDNLTADPCREAATLSPQSV